MMLSKNYGFQCIRDLQMHASGRDFGNEFRRRDPQSNRLDGDFIEIDFAANAASFGARAFEVQTAAELEEAVFVAYARRPGAEAELEAGI